MIWDQMLISPLSKSGPLQDVCCSFIKDTFLPAEAFPIKGEFDGSFTVNISGEHCGHQF